MESWESIIKNKLDGYESQLPEDGYARLENATSQAKPVRRFRYVLGFTTVAAAAAVAVLFFLRRPADSASCVRLIAIETIPPVEIVAPQIPKPALLSAPMKKTRSECTAEKSPDQGTGKTETTIENLPPADVSDADSGISSLKASQPALGIKTNQESAPVRQLQQPASHLKKAGIGTAGAGLIASALVIMRSGNRETIAGPGGSTSSIKRHYLPFRAGLSVGIPLSESTRITTGLVYSYYRSSESSGDGLIQSVHYMSLPLRLDWSFVSRSWGDLYFGAGVEANQCIASTLAGNKLNHNDRMDFSLQGVVGAQWLASEHVGFYLEPTLSWLPSAPSLELKTYRTQHPVMFSMVFGCRWIIINK